MWHFFSTCPQISIEFRPNKTQAMLYLLAGFSYLSPNFSQGYQYIIIMKHSCLLSLSILFLALPAKSQVSGSFTFDGVNRNYLAYVPTASSQNSPIPVVLVLHGFTQTAQGIMAYSGFNAVAESEGFIAVYPNGVNLTWNVGFSATGADDIGFLNALIDTLSHKYTVDPERIYACGMSNGGFMSYRLACELSGRIAAIASVAGSMTTETFNTCHPQRAVPVLEIHGTSDLIVNYNGATGIKSISEVIGYWTGQNNCPQFPETILLPDIANEGSRVERSVYRPCSDYSEVVLMKIINGGHTWPGSANSGFGNTNRDILASREIWEFFRRFTLSGTPNPTEETQEELLLKVFPNPASTNIRIVLERENPSGRQTTLRLLNYQGQTVLQQVVATSPVDLFVGNLPSGIYLLEILCSDGVAKKRLLIN